MTYMDIVLEASKAAQEGNTELTADEMNDALQSLGFPRCFERMVRAAKSVYHNTPGPGEY